MRPNPIPLIAIGLFCFLSTTAQTGARFDLQLKSGSFIPERNISADKLAQFNRGASRVANRMFVVLQFEQLPDESTKSLLRSSGIELLDYIPQNAFTATVAGDLRADILTQVKARSVIELSAFQKMQAELASGNFPAWSVKISGTVDVQIRYPKTFEANEVINELRNKNFTIISTLYQSYRILTIRVSVQRLGELAQQPFVEYVEAVPGEDKTLNDFTNWGRDATKASLLVAPLSQGGRGLTGSGVVVGIGDNSDPQTHIDFTNRLINRSAGSYAFHGTHVAGIAGGGGIGNELRTGFARKATLLTQLFSGVFLNASAYVTDHNMVITNNSYGNNIAEPSTFGVYNLYSVVLDQQAFTFPHLQNVFASGNSGTIFSSLYTDSFRTVVGGYQTAKNVLTVGNASPVGAIFQTSSRGPTRDGRIKPEIVTIGSFIMSSSTNQPDTYFENTGTSMATPAASGGLALLYERYRQLNPVPPPGLDPPNGLMKALVCNSGNDWGNPGPDYTHGFGLANFWRAGIMLEDNHYFSSAISPGPAQDQVIVVPAGLAELKVMLYWNDPAASPLALPTLVNNLDLEVINPSSVTVLPLVLDSTRANIKRWAEPGVDNLNNIEQVVIKNPAAGSYTLRVKPTNVPVGPSQEYFLVYDFVPQETKVMAPIGGEAYVPGDLMVIQWDSYGDPQNPFTVEYSLNNGSSWTVLNNNVPATKREYIITATNEWWTVNDVPTDVALVRVSRNGTGFSGTTLPFTILRLPTVTLSSVQCEGYISIDWTTVPGATGYEVMMLRGDEMVSVQTLPSSASTYTISGLSKDTTYWVSVRGIINGKPGRRALAISRQPNSGNCAGAISDNDIKLDSILSPTRSGRVLTSTALGNSVPVSIRIKNLDDAVTPGNITVTYVFDGGIPQVETITSPNIGAGLTFDHTFGVNINPSVIGTHQLDITVTQTGDPVPAYNSGTLIIKQLDNPAITGITPVAPQLDNFDAASIQSYNTDQIGLIGLDRYDFVNSTDFGRIRTFINSGLAYSGNRALTLDSKKENAGTTDSLTGTFNLATYSSATDDIRVDFQYKNHGQGSNNANKVWARGDDTKTWVEVYDLDDNQNPVDGTFKKTTSIQLSDLLFAAGQNFSSSFQLRFGQFGGNQAADNDGSSGYTFDDIRLYKAVDDMEMISIDAPAPISCNLTASTAISITVKNNSNAALPNVPVRYKIDAGSWLSPAETLPSPVAANATASYTFTANADLSAPGQHTIYVVVDYPSDNFHDNDTVTLSVNNSPVYTVTNTTPYLQNFETDDGGWHAAGKNSSWEYGTPASLKINRAASGTKAWKTRLVGSYNDNELSYLYSPCFDISTVTSPTLSLSLSLDLEDCGSGFTCDGTWVEYSTDGTTWTRLGASGQGTNWYNRAYSGNNMWSVENYNRWHVATIPLPVSSNQLRLRFAVSSDIITFRDGVGIDDIHIYSNVNGIYDVTGTSPVVNQAAVNGSGWINFIESGTNKLIASVDPLGQNLGSTDVQSYIHTGAVRVNSDQYYHNRNITIKPTTVNLPDSASVRFYFLDSETEALINATGCSYCFKPKMAYELGVTKYSDADDSKENGTLADNTPGNYLFINAAKAVKVPFDKGYYAEFKVKNFSEFWLNNGGFDLNTPLPVELLSFTAKKKQNTDVLAEWKTATESNVNRYEVEVARGNQEYQYNRFIKIGEVTARGNSTIVQSYSFTDSEPFKKGVHYYRLKIVDNDGRYSYSPVRPVVFDESINWQVYPNPSEGLFTLSYQVNDGETLNARIIDIQGRTIKEMNVKGDGFMRKMVIDLSNTSYAKGLYLLEASVNGKQQSFRLLKQ